LDWLSHSPT